MHFKKKNKTIKNGIFIQFFDHSNKSNFYDFP